MNKPACFNARSVTTSDHEVRTPAPASAFRVEQFRSAFAAAGATHSVLLASTFRSGSTYVAELLRHNGITGLSIEKFNTIWQVSEGPDAAFRDAVDRIARTSEDGLFAAKIMWTHRSDLARCLRLERSQTAMLAESFPDPKWIWVRRRDKVRQAISFWRAKQSGRWHVFDGSAETPVEYDFQAILACYSEMLMHDACWEDFFEQAGIAPFVVDYESLSCDLPNQLAALLTFIGKPVGEEIATEVRLKRQRDALTEQIYHRFMDDCHRNG